VLRHIGFFVVGRIGLDEDLRQIVRRRPDSAVSEERTGDTALDRGQLLLVANGACFGAIATRAWN
jgi:hypothetical protein